jgi:cardiolipin synthase A/B
MAERRKSPVRVSCRLDYDRQGPRVLEGAIKKTHKSPLATGGFTRRPAPSPALPRPPRITPARMIPVLTLLIGLAAASGCSSLPDVQRLLLDFRQSGKSPGVVGTEGILTPESRAEAFSALRGADGSTDAAEESPRVEETVGVVEIVGGTPAFCGNKATLLVDGQVTYAHMLDAIDDAKDHVNLETYTIEDDDVGRRFADLLLKKRAQGVTINLIYDAFGCRRTPQSFFDRLREGGVSAIAFNPVVLGRLWGRSAFYRRTHKKTLVVDGTIAFTGGVNIGSAYTRSRPPRDKTSPPSDFWQDTDIMVEGPAVAAFQELFLRTWLAHSGAPPAAAHYFPPAEAKGDQMVQVVGSTHGYAQRGTYVMYVSAVALARKSVHITHSYFAPDPQMMKALVDAAKRGVDVRIILPEHSDHDIVRQAARRHYKELLDAGIRLYERSGAVLHSKTAVVDGVWSTVGSTNLDLWSFVTNDETNAVVIGRQFAHDMEDSFQKDLEQSREILPDEWNRRPLTDRAKELISDLFHYWL